MAALQECHDLCHRTLDFNDARIIEYRNVGSFSTSKKHITSGVSAAARILATYH